MSLRREAREAGADLLLALVAVLPLVPLLVAVARADLPRFSLTGDYASLELQTWMVPTGKTLLGPYSRFGFNHPGPLYFYVLAPVYAVMGGRSNALFVGAVLVAMLSAASIVVALARHASRAHALGASVVLAAWYAAYGNLATVPWNPFVVVVPLVAFTVFVALVLAGRSGAAVPAVVFGSFAAQTHLSTLPYVAALGLACASALAWRTWKLRSRREALALAWPVLAVAILWSPIAVEQLASGEGNVTKMLRLFTARPEPPQPWGAALGQLVELTSWLPRRALDGAVATEGVEPDPMRSAVLTLPTETTATLTAVATGIALAVAGAVARRRGDRVSLALLGAAAGALVVSIVAFRNVVGVPVRYLLFWGTAGGTCALLGLATLVASVVASALPRAGRAVLGIGVAVAMFAASRHTSASAATRGIGLWSPNPNVEIVHRALLARLDRDGAVPVLHGGPGWSISMGLQLALVREGRPIRIMPSERWFLGRQFPAPAPGERVVHVYTDTAPFTLAIAPCLETVTQSGDAVLYVAAEERVACERAPAAIAH